ncbi:PrsW family intramembrane metalloprotease [Leptospira semungkisensis]|uniref:PrsW family intramembrane metalloprotease n=2 Tax=Leptospira semungkisensis TaxID=2484985 RepID=A0A4R9FYB9_9LEPT|nr:PrsW family intramembrane metalloprotease [Leptospira semungkisensis]
MYDWLVFLKPAAAVLAAWFYWDFYRKTYYSGQGRIFTILAFFYGMIATGIALAWEIGVFDLFESYHPFQQAVLLGALPEETAKALLIYLFLKKEKGSSNLADSLYFGLTVGVAFGCIENVFYSFQLDFWPGILRSGTSLPFHTFSGGILGFFILKTLQSRKGNLSGLDFCLSFLFLTLLHGLYNFLLLEGGLGTAMIPLILGLSFLTLELIVVQAEVTLPFEVLQSENLYLDDYAMIRKFSRYDAWLRAAQSNESIQSIPLLRDLSLERAIISVFLFGIPLFCLNFYLFVPAQIPYYLENISSLEFITLFMEYPAWLGFLFLVRGLLNPSFFRERILKIPLFLSVNLGAEGEEEPSLAYSLSRKGFYSPVIREPELNRETFVSFYIAGKSFEKIKVVPIWKNFRENDPSHESGALYRFSQIPWGLLTWRWLVRIKQQYRNAVEAVFR